MSPPRLDLPSLAPFTTKILEASGMTNNAIVNEAAKAETTGMPMRWK